MLNKMINGFKQVCSTVGISYTLDDLNDALELSQSTDDPKHIMKFVEHIHSFWANDKPIAIKSVKNAFWKEEPSNHYIFTSLFKSLTSDDLLTLIRNIGNNTTIKVFIFKHHYKEILSHYQINDLLKLLSAHYSDPFALFIFYKFVGFMNWSILSRASFLNSISIHVTVMVLNENDIFKLSANQSMIIFQKMTKYIQSTPKHELRSILSAHGYIREIQYNLSKIIPDSIYNLIIQYVNYQKMYCCISKNIIQKTVQLLSNEDLYFVFSNHLVSSIELKCILMELKRRKKNKRTDLETQQRQISIDQNQCDAVMHVPSRSVFDNTDELYINRLKNHIHKINGKYSDLIKDIRFSNVLQTELNYLTDAIQEIETAYNAEQAQQKIAELEKKLSYYQH